MIIFKLLNVDDFYATTENIEIAKGKHKLPTSLKQSYKLLKRELIWRMKQAT